MRPYRPRAVVGEHPAHIGLLLEDTEMVEPEPHHLFFELRRRIDGAQQFTAPRLIGGLVALVIEFLPGGLLVWSLRQRVDALLLEGYSQEQPLSVDLIDRQVRH